MTVTMCRMCGEREARYMVDDYVVRDGVRVLSTSWPMCVRCASSWLELLDRCGATTAPAPAGDGLETQRGAGQ